MKLFKVRIEYETVVRAESAKQAEKDAEYIIRNAADDPAEIVIAQEITKLEDLPKRWSAQCRPWGERDPMDRTLGAMLNKVI